MLLNIRRNSQYLYSRAHWHEAATLVSVKPIYLRYHLLHAKQVIEFKPFQMALKDK